MVLYAYKHQQNAPHLPISKLAHATRKEGHAADSWKARQYGIINPFFHTVPTCAFRETASLGIIGAPAVPPLCRETQSLGQQMLELSCENATVGTNGLMLWTGTSSARVRTPSR